jgi:hypothetical protein
MHELAYNLESFNPAFTAVLLAVQRTIGLSDYVRRDTALKHLIQPLAGEYGMHNNEPQGEGRGDCRPPLRPCWAVLHLAWEPPH